MFFYGGIIYRIWAVSGVMFLLGVVCIAIEKPWSKPFRIQNYTVGILLLIFSLLSCTFYVSRVISPHIQCYEGEFIGENRDPRVAPPLPLTYKFVFSNGDNKDQPFYLDVISRRKIIPSGFSPHKTYRVFYDGLTLIIVKVEECI